MTLIAKPWKIQAFPAGLAHFWFLKSECSTKVSSGHGAALAGQYLGHRAGLDWTALLRLVAGG
jgi:hypothetical protein